MSCHPTDTADPALLVQAPGLLRYLRLLGADTELAAELLQDVALIYLEGGFVDGDATALRSWLRRTGRNLLFSRRRQDQRRLRAWAARVDNWMETHETLLEGPRSPWVEALEQCMAEIGGRPAEVLRRIYGEGEDRHALAAELGLRPLGLKTLLQRSKRLLRRCVERRI